MPARSKDGLTGKSGLLLVAQLFEPSVRNYPFSVSVCMSIDRLPEVLTGAFAITIKKVLLTNHVVSDAEFRRNDPAFAKQSVRVTDFPDTKIWICFVLKSPWQSNRLTMLPRFSPSRRGPLGRNSPCALVLRGVHGVAPLRLKAEIYFMNQVLPSERSR